MQRMTRMKSILFGINLLFPFYHLLGNDNRLLKKKKEKQFLQLSLQELILHLLILFYERKVELGNDLRGGMSCA